MSSLTSDSEITVYESRNFWNVSWLWRHSAAVALLSAWHMRRRFTRISFLRIESGHAWRGQSGICCLQATCECMLLARAWFTRFIFVSAVCQPEFPGSLSFLDKIWSKSCVGVAPWNAHLNLLFQFFLSYVSYVFKLTWLFSLVYLRHLSPAHRWLPNCLGF